MLENKNKILSGISIDLFGSIIGTILGFVIVPFYFRYITSFEFGIWLAVSGLTALITMVDLGTDQYLTTVTASDKKFYSSNYSDYLTSIIIIKTFISFIFIIAGGAILYFINDLIDINKNYLNISKLVFVLGVINIILNTYTTTINSILYSRHHYRLINLSTTLSTLLTSFFTLFLLMIGFEILSFPLAILSANILQTIFLLFFLLRNYPNVKLNLKEHKFIDRNEILSYSTKFQMLKWVQTLRSQYILIAINNLTGPLDVVKYNFTYRIPQIVPNYALKIVHPFFPSISDLFEKGELLKVQSVFNKISLILFRIAFFAGLSIIFLNESFIKLWVGSDKFAGNFVLYLLVAYLVVFVSLGAFGIIIYASKNFENWTKWSLVEILVSIISSYYLSFEFGLTGIVIGYVFGSFITQFYLFYIVLNQLKLNKIYFLIKMFKYAFFSNIYCLLFGVVIFAFFKIDSWISFIFAILGFVMFALINDFILIINSKEIGLKKKIQKSMFL